MDLRSVLNTADNGERQPPKPSPKPQSQYPPQRPPESPAQYGYREHPQHAPQPSPVRPGPASHDYGQHPSQYPPGHYPPQSPYQQQPGAFQPRPGGPAPFQDVRSPGAGPTPYRPLGTPSQQPGAGSGYPFPQGHPPQEIHSPSQRHQYPPAPYQHQRRDSHSGPPTQHPTTPYVQQHPIPQTPPIATSQHPQQQIHQRSQSAQSTPTPTSAHSQHQFGPPYVQGSPAGAPPAPPSDYNRHPSQPPTPLGPPLNPGSRHASGSSYQQLASPYQHKIQGPGAAPPGQAPQGQVSGPPDVPQQHIRRTSTSHSSHEQPLQEQSYRPSAPPSAIDREHSMSVSPKTRVGSLPSNAENPASRRASDTKPPARPPTAAQAMAEADKSRVERAVTPAKRKLGDRSMSPAELDQQQSRPPPPGEVNGRPGSSAKPSASPAVLRKKRSVWSQPPVWAQDASTLGKSPPNHPNFVLQKRVHANTNGKRDSVGRPSSAGRGETTSAPTAGPAQEPARAASAAAPATAAPLAAAVPAESGPQDILGPWEASILGVKPYEEVSKAIADFLFIHVVNGNDIQEVLSRGIEFEIEAKLGTLIDKDTNHRVDRGLESECILQDTGRIAFKSSMTEAQHKSFNEFLNQVVIQTDPRAPQGQHRVQVHYKHRREIDRFFELPPDLQGRLPGCIRSRLGSRSRNVKVRVTYDQRTNEVLNKIVKARVADIHLHMPTCPMDCRISINLEMNWDGPVLELEQLPVQGERSPDRGKDRLSYKQGHYQIDLTQVTQTGNNKEHELEIELASSVLIEQGRLAMGGGTHKYPELVEGFVDNVRALARKARDFQ